MTVAYTFKQCADALNGSEPTDSVSVTKNLPTTEPATMIEPTTEPPEVCGGPGWRRVAYLDMTDPNQNCPTGLSQTSYSVRSCGRPSTAQYASCFSTLFQNDGSQYSEVCEEQQHTNLELVEDFLQSIIH